MVRKRILATLLICMLAFNFYSCNKKEEKDSIVTSDTTTPPTDFDSESQAIYKDSLPDFDFDGYEFRMLSHDQNSKVNIVTLVDAEDETGDVIVDSIYKRNRAIEERFNMKFKASYVPNYEELTKKLKSSVKAGSDDYDNIMLISRDAFSTALEGMIVPVKDLKYVDITKPWYSHQVNEQLTIGGNLYFAYSDECLNMFEQTLMVLFNKAMLRDFQLDNPYELVKNGKWTIDKFFEMATTVVTDLNGDKKLTDADKWGVVTENDMFYPCFWVSSYVKTIMKDENDEPYFSAPGNEKFFTILDKVLSYVKQDGVVFDTFNNKNELFTKGTGEEIRNTSNTMFTSGVSLFRVGHVGILKNLREMKDDFGILPLPKYDEAQENYLSRVIDGWINVVPVTNTNTERTSVIMEALAVESKNTVVPAYYEVALKEKFSRDTESKEMLDLIYNTRTLDLGDTIWMYPIRQGYVDLLVNRKDTFASTTEKLIPQVDQILQKSINAMRELES